MVGNGGDARHDGRREGTGALDLTRRASPEPGRGAQQDMYEEARLDTPPSRWADMTLGHGKVIKIASLNVKSIRKATLHMQIERYMKDRDITIVCLQETWVAQTTQYVVGDLLYVTHGHGGQEREYAGVGFVFRPDARKCITGFELGPEGRIISVGLDFAPRRLTLISAYMPQSRRDEDEREGIIDALDTFISRSQKKRGHDGDG